MKIHHLNCATMCPPSPLITTGEGPLWGSARMVCHCLLIESRDGLILVDSGLGTGDLAHPREHLGAAFLTFVKPKLQIEETAVYQVRALGFSPKDLRHIVLTHLDLDHAGGISDFPEAEVHVTHDEHRAAMHPQTLFEKHRYKPVHWAHGPRWVTHSVDGEHWRGFDCVRALGSTDDEVLLVPLPGHTRGHACVAVNTGEGWMLHCGDAYFFREEVHPAHPRRTPGFTAFQWLAHTTHHRLSVNHARLQRLVAEHGPELRVFCAHDPSEHAWLSGDRTLSPPPGLSQYVPRARSTP